MMIKIIRAEYLGNHKVGCSFSDGAYGVYDMDFIFAYDTVLVTPLKNEEYFRTFFLDMGCLCWKNGLELSPAAIYRELRERQRLICPDSANQVA
jgi:hypothetical protein